VAISLLPLGVKQEGFVVFDRLVLFVVQVYFELNGVSREVRVFDRRESEKASRGGKAIHRRPVADKANPGHGEWSDNGNMQCTCSTHHKLMVATPKLVPPLLDVEDV